jgi:sulfate transport system permease protein
LVVEQKYNNFAQGEAYAVSFILVLISVLCILVVSLLRPKESAS